ncbi:MAG: OmpA family protein [Polyangiaceae bacterium]|nr:OmpA family protein [Polyangiaceae bacterium]
MPESKKRQGRRIVREAAAATIVIAALPATAALGCYDNSLPQVAVPKPEGQKPPPAWFPEQPWTEKTAETRIYIRGKIVFDTNKSVILPQSEEVLKKLLEFVGNHPEITRFRIEGHTDSRASEDHNQALSARRALAVCDWLVDKGVDHARLIAVGFGESRPLAPNELSEGRDDNRRVEFHVAEVRGRPFLGKDPYDGGFALVVKSKEEREREKEAERLARLPPPKPPPYKRSGNEVQDINVTELQAQLQKKRDQQGDTMAAPSPKK